MMTSIAMIPARMGSQRLKQKNLRELDGIPLITHAIRKAKATNIFKEIWVNSEDLVFKKIAETEGVLFHHRPNELANNQATSEQYIYEFLKKHPSDILIQIHSIAPLLSVKEIKDFVEYFHNNSYDVLLSVVEEQIECAYKNKPINFNFDHKTNSQELNPIQRITWSISGWRSLGYIRAYEKGKCATYFGQIGFFPISRSAGHIIKTEEDFKIASALKSINEKA